MTWNCRSLEDSSTIAQLKKSIRLHLSDMVFVCETKQTRDFIGTMYKKLKFGDRWVVSNPVIDKNGGLLVDNGKN